MTLVNFIALMGLLIGILGASWAYVMACCAYLQEAREGLLVAGAGLAIFGLTQLYQ